MTRLALFSIIAIALAAPGRIRAQDIEKPLPRVSVKLIRDSDGKRVTFNLPVPHRTVDRAFVTWAAVSQIATIADVENSIYAGRGSGVYEVNWLYGSHPSRDRYYAVSQAIWAFGTYVSRRSKRENDAARAFGARPDFTHRMWWLPQFGNAAAHLIGIGFTIARTGR
jgi:hypothetical protein